MSAAEDSQKGDNARSSDAQLVGTTGSSRSASENWVLPSSPRALVILAWATGLAGLYVLISFAQAVWVERIFSVDVGFGRGLAFWIGTIYLALLGWGFLPKRPRGWYARRSWVFIALAVGLASAAICGTLTALWLAAHWAPTVGLPVTGSIIAVLVAGVGVLWLAAREDRSSSQAD